MVRTIFYSLLFGLTTAILSYKVGFNKGRASLTAEANAKISQALKLETQ